MIAPPKIELDPFTIAFLSDGIWRNDGGCMFGVVPRELWEKTHPADPRNRILLNLTCPLILRGKQAILIDCGIGNRLSPSERDGFSHGDGYLPEHLRALGMEPGDVTHVLLSHLHFDHFGGIIRADKSGAAKSAFPRARIFIQRGEYEIACNSKNPRLRAAYRHAAECLAPLGDQLELIQGDTELLDGVNALVTGGHTADHQIALVRGVRHSFVHLADIVPTRAHLKPAYNQAYDLDALRTMDEKARYLSRAVLENWWVSFAHDDQIFTAHVEADQGKISLSDIVAVDRRIFGGNKD